MPWRAGPGAPPQADARGGAHARDADVVQHVLAVEVEAPSDLQDALGAEGALRVEDERAALAAADLLGQLRRHRERQAELALADAVLAVDLGD